MCIDSKLEIDAKGFQRDYAMDGSMWFEFVAETDQIENVFTTKIDTKSFRDGIKFHGNPKPNWWHAEQYELTGGQAQVANGSYIDVAYKKNDNDTLTVFIFWFET